MTLASLRKKKKLTQRSLAEIICVSPSTIAMYETGKRTPSLLKAKEIAKCFGVNVEDISFANFARKTQAGVNCLAKNRATLIGKHT